MSWLRDLLDRMEPHFTKGGRLEKFGAVYEAADTLFYSPSSVTRGTPHVRDAVDLKRVMVLRFAACSCSLGIAQRGVP